MLVLITANQISKTIIEINQFMSKHSLSVWNHVRTADLLPEAQENVFSTKQQREPAPNYCAGRSNSGMHTTVLRAFALMWVTLCYISGCILAFWSQFFLLLITHGFRYGSKPR